MGIRAKLSIEVAFLIILSFVVSGVFLYFVGNKYVLQRNMSALREAASEVTFDARNAVIRGDLTKLDKIINNGILNNRLLIW